MTELGPTGALASLRAGQEVRATLANPATALTIVVFGVVAVALAVFEPSTPFDEDGPYLPWLVAGLPAAAMLTVGVVALAQSVSAERSDGTLLRLRALPQGVRGYIAGRALAFSELQLLTASLIALAAIAGGLWTLAPDVGSSLVLLVAFALGIVVHGLLGVLTGAMLRMADAASAGATLVSLGAMAGATLTGLLIPLSVMPESVQIAGLILPTTWLAHAVRYALVPDAVGLEPLDDWHPLAALLVLAVWAAVLALVVPRVLQARTKRPTGSPVDAAAAEPAPTPTTQPSAAPRETMHSTRPAPTPAGSALEDNDDAACVIDVSGLQMAYGDAQVLRGLDLRIRRGEVYALLGPNGAGKTTAVEIMEGYRRRSAGEVMVLGRDPEHGDDAWRNRIGIVLQRATDHEQWNVRSLLRYAAAHFDDPWPADDLLERVDLVEQARQKIDDLSGGQRRRLDVALGLVGRPELLFLDEPTTGFDPEVRRRFWNLVEDVAATGTTVLLTTHYLDEAQHLADRIGVLSGGRIHTEGTVEELGRASGSRAVVSWQDGGRTRTEHTDDPGRTVAGLVERLGTVEALEVRRPNLEDIYLDIVAAQRAGDRGEEHSAA